MNFREKIKQHKNIILKIGTTTIVNDKGEINLEKLDKFAKVLSFLNSNDKNILLVSSGAIAVGAKEIGLKKRPRDTLGQQVTSAIGQVHLIKSYEKVFKKYNQKIAQILLTREVFLNLEKAENFKNSLLKMFELNIIPIINENDTISFDNTLKSCDNDTLASQICALIGADMVILLSDIDGMYTKNPKNNLDSKLIEVVTKIDDNIEKIAEKPSDPFGTGGMITKINAAKIANKAGAELVICSGENPNVILDVLDGKNVGTLFCSLEN